MSRNLAQGQRLAGAQSRACVGDGGIGVGS